MAKDLHEAVFLFLKLARLPVPPSGHCEGKTTNLILGRARVFVNEAAAFAVPPRAMSKNGMLARASVGTGTRGTRHGMPVANRSRAIRNGGHCFT